MKRLQTLLCVMFFAWSIGCSGQSIHKQSKRLQSIEQASIEAAYGNELAVHFIDAGQADGTLFQSTENGAVYTILGIRC